MNPGSNDCLLVPCFLGPEIHLQTHEYAPFTLQNKSFAKLLKFPVILQNDCSSQTFSKITVSLISQNFELFLNTCISTEPYSHLLPHLRLFCKII